MFVRLTMQVHAAREVTRIVRDLEWPNHLPFPRDPNDMVIFDLPDGNELSYSVTWIELHPKPGGGPEAVFHCRGDVSGEDARVAEYVALGWRKA